MRGCILSGVMFYLCESSMYADLIGSMYVSMYVNHLTVHPPINGAFVSVYAIRGNKNKNWNWNWKDSDPVCWWKLRVGSRLQVDRWTGLDLLPTTYYLLTPVSVRGTTGLHGAVQFVQSRPIVWWMRKLPTYYSTLWWN
ncbi:hypothetical protein BO86DRAFT_456735 [Aspergillus japonicus CBS 114.51]|uniref:Uncharacterized protein n=1 Tax=Aspergillus japonicus CBS 114.51 TaxID=1448312 RepID=A0A8T8X0J8_ASPJA|nr:hypothetical protein BO86DRAFT_456735 [Aspergillus japonicus CBS 114.51]RAH81079.1 hypothetical protein BO86DRAFT_456735 [Aspergillus japonicus CBS 114.51]